MATLEEIMKTIGLGGKTGLSAASAMNPYAAVAEAVPQVFQGILGAAQTIHGDQMAKRAVRPWETVPAAQQEAVANARNLYAADAPGLQQSRDLMTQNAAGSVAGINQGGGSTNEKLAAIVGLNNNANLDALKLGADQSEWKARQAGNLQNMDMQLADTQQHNWETNKMQPYMNLVKQAADQRNSGIQNLHGALTGLGGTVAAAMTDPQKPAAKVAAPKPFDPDMGSSTTYDFAEIDPSAGDAVMQEDKLSSVQPITGKTATGFSNALRTPSLMPVGVEERSRRGLPNPKMYSGVYENAMKMLRGY